MLMHKKTVLRILLVPVIAIFAISVLVTPAVAETWATTSMDYLYDYERVMVGTGILDENHTFHWKIESPHPVNIYFLDVDGFNDKYAGGTSYTKLGLVEGITIDEGSFQIPYYDGWQMIIESAYSGSFEVQYTAWSVENSDLGFDDLGICDSAIMITGVGLTGLVAVVVTRR